MKDESKSTRSPNENQAVCSADYSLVFGVAQHERRPDPGKAMLRSGTSVGAHYREGCRARSTAEFISKLEGGLQELEETAYWLELLVEGEVVPVDKMRLLQQETDELIAIIVTCVKRVKGD